MTADESLVTLNGLKKYDQKKGTAVVEANELPASPLNKVYNVSGADGENVYSKDVRLSTYQQMIDEVDKVKVDGNTQDANRNIISKAVIEQANVPPTPLDKVYNIGGSPIELTASGTCTHETSPGGTETVTINNLQPGTDVSSLTPGTYTLTYTEDTSWESKEITYRGLTFTAVKMYESSNLVESIFADSVTIDGTTHSNVTNGEVFTGTGWVIIWNDSDHLARLYLTDANATLPVVSVTVASGLNGWKGNFTVPAGTTEVTFNNDYVFQLDTQGHTLDQLPYGEHAIYGTTYVEEGQYKFAVYGYNLPSPTATIVTPGSGLYMGDCFINHLPAGGSFKLKSSIDNVWHTVNYPLPENGAFIYGTSLSEESCMVIQVNNQLRVITIDDTQGQAFTVNYEEETSTRVFSKSVELITKDAANDLFIPQSEKGVASGVATLGADGKVPRSQLTVEAMEYKGKVYLNTAEPTDKSVGDVYFVGETGTIWGKSVNEGDQLVWSGSAWDVWSAGRVLSVDGKTNEVVINQALTSTQYNNLTAIDPLVNYFITDKKQIYRNGYCYSIKVVALSQSDYNNLTPFQKQDTMALYIVDNNKLYYLDNPVGMLGNELRYTSSIPTEEGFFVYTGNVPNAAGLFAGCIYYARQASDRWVYDLFTPKYSEDIIEKSAFTHLQTSANATQHAVNEAIDHEFYVNELAIGNNETSITNLRNQLNNLRTTDVAEPIPLSSIGSPAFDSQHAINIAFDSELGKKPNVWIGHKADWDLLSVAEKTKYDEAHFDDDSDTDASQVTDAVTDGDMRAVTSNAVYDAVNPLKVETKSGFSVPVPAETSTNNSWLVTVHSKEINNNSLGSAIVTRTGNTLYIFNITITTSSGGTVITIQEDGDNAGQIKTNYTGLNYGNLMNWNFSPMGRFLF